MSSILKALKRLERDQARRQDDNVDLARDILRGDGRRLGPPSWLLPLLALLVLLLGLTLAVLLWPQRERASDASFVVAPAPPAAVTVPAGGEPAIVEELIARRRLLQPVPPPAVATATAVSRPPVTPPPATVPLVPLAPTVVPVVPIESATPPVGGSETALAVSAILYQDEPSARIAVVNDLPVMEGTMIGELRVEEIRPDRVIFSRQGVRFAVPYDAH